MAKPRVESLEFYWRQFCKETQNDPRNEDAKKVFIAGLATGRAIFGILSALPQQQRIAENAIIDKQLRSLK